MPSPLQTSLLEATILLQGLLAALFAASSVYHYPHFMHEGQGTAQLIVIPIWISLWVLLLLTILTQIRLNAHRITTAQTLYLELTKSGIVTVLVVIYLLSYFLGPPGYGGPGYGRIGGFQRAYAVVLFLVFNLGLFSPTLWFGWKATREGGISLSERAESLLPQ